ncbi:MAG TPA: dihydroneopterin aldolase [Anaerolineales bacterium]|nr:dihydroneopterin aldolase [Anaerolineales bacterium]
MDKIIIKNLLARGIIGVNDWEREKPQDILINIEIEADLRRAGESDDIDHTVNYRTVAKKAIALAEGSGKRTVEALAEAIAEAALETERADRVRVRVEKPGAVRFAESVGVEIDRMKRLT